MFCPSIFKGLTDSHFVSFERCSMDIGCIAAVTLLVASYWLLSSSCFPFFVQKFHITSPYSSSCLIKENYMVSRDVLSKKNFNLRNMFILIQAFFFTLLIWLRQIQSFDSRITRCLCSVTSCIYWLNIMRGGCGGGNILREMRRNSVFNWLKVTNHFSDQVVILFQSN